MDGLRELHGRCIRYILVAHPTGSFAEQIGNPANLSCAFGTNNLMTTGQNGTCCKNFEKQKNYQKSKANDLTDSPFYKDRPRPGTNETESPSPIIV
jgi:hypothetical protein